MHERETQEEALRFGQLWSTVFLLFSSTDQSPSEITSKTCTLWKGNPPPPPQRLHPLFSYWRASNEMLSNPAALSARAGRRLDWKLHEMSSLSPLRDSITCRKLFCSKCAFIGWFRKLCCSVKRLFATIFNLLSPLPLDTGQVIKSWWSVALFIYKSCWKHLFRLVE